MLNWKLTFNFDNFKQGLEEKVARADNVRPAMQVIAQDMLKEVQLNFRGEKTPDNEKWKPSQRALRESGKTLSDTGRLKKSISGKFDGLSAAVGTNVEYAAIHQFGGTFEIRERSQYQSMSYNKKTGKLMMAKKSKSNIKFGITIRAHSVNIPDRKYLGINYVQRRRYERIISNYLLHGKLIMK